MATNPSYPILVIEHAKGRSAVEQSAPLSNVVEVVHWLSILLFEEKAAYGLWRVPCAEGSDAVGNLGYLFEESLMLNQRVTT